MNTVEKNIMDLRQNFSKLSKHEISIEAFKNTPSFLSLEDNPGVIEEVQKFHLPYITALICMSDKLVGCAWADQYAKLREYCLYPEKIDICSILNKYIGRADDFRTDWLSLEFYPIINRYMEFFDENDKQLNELAEQKEGEAQRELDETPKKRANKKRDIKAKRKQQYDEIEKGVEEINNTIRITAQHRQYVLETIHNIDEESICKREENAMRVIKSMPADEVYMFLDDYIKSGVLSETMFSQIQQEQFRKKLLSCLSEKQYREYAFPALCRLHDEGAINLENAEFQCFIEQHVSLLNEYLQSVYDENSSVQKAGKEILLQSAVRIESKGKGESFKSIWQLFSKESDWKWLFNELEKFYPARENKYVIKFIRYISGAAAKAFVYCAAQDDRIQLRNVLEEMTEHNDTINSDIVMDVLDMYERTYKHLKLAENKMRSTAKELFSHVEKPIDELETYASILYCSQKNVDLMMVGKDLLEKTDKLRDGLSKVGVSPLIDTDDWIEQSAMEYDEKVHKAVSNIASGNKLGKVKPRTRGFRYQDEDGNDRIYPASVYLQGYYTDCYKPTTRSRTQKVKNTPSQKKHSKGHEQKKRLRGEKNGI